MSTGIRSIEEQDCSRMVINALNAVAMIGKVQSSRIMGDVYRR
jgi:hypothetical protein